jgi:hypothetical protein
MNYSHKKTIYSVYFNLCGDGASPPPVVMVDSSGSSDVAKAANQVETELHTDAWVLLVGVDAAACALVHAELIRRGVAGPPFVEVDVE